MHVKIRLRPKPRLKVQPVIQLKPVMNNNTMTRLRMHIADTKLYRQCQGKKCHRDAVLADMEAERLRGLYPGEEFNTYPCPNHEGRQVYHVGHTFARRTVYR